MADRIFAAITLLIVVAYGWAAFMIIKAPFQYDPLGPESWPRILSVLAGLCCLWIIFKPDVDKIDITHNVLVRLVIMVVLLLGYAYLFEHAGFILSTTGFCIGAAYLLGAKPVHALIFGAATGIIGYVLGAKLLALNLPAGLFKSLF
ncbi:tripartite tricarboxylate transporter TctB family protein [Thiofilum flexile]|uniref:tripartite tricarboxylate transporter TctB family protein n=1 Tax=Thiofilum flexile TaxID=125627 RepID=UPI00037D16C9|nr:tripartite tricarboxylate transporter TctB family protein [Thiofilum flexile]